MEEIFSWIGFTIPMMILGKSLIQGDHFKIIVEKRPGTLDHHMLALPFLV